ncbi:MAG: hypothetical protein ACD_2C00131G0008 [uncultured bacterium (gcode 4)]|uniref:Prepilin-type N-terminal cleavage/methylation domain-containing protein n=1 Tax=uncultured bacterium (gcode 4) TaxID=1234023 RepID=K2G389_9BACT|nr:MAG: hypothetical protein ACD_2C00131G0008 [uncultured bacterium (gcode 4)]
MAKHRSQAFTYIEILISIVVLATVSVVWLSSFQAFFSKQSVVRIQEKIVNIARWLDIDISSWNISSYTLFFSSWANSLVANIDYYKSPQLITLKWFDYANLSWSLVTNNTSTWFWETKIYLDDVLKNDFFNNWSWGSVPLSLWNYTLFETLNIKSKIWSIDTNSIRIYRLDYSKGEGDNTENAYINSIKSTAFADSAYIENILWKKTMHTIIWWNTWAVDSADISILKWTTEASFTLKP